MTDPKSLTMVVSYGQDAAAVYDESGARIDTGHIDSVTERLIERVGVTVEYVSDLVTDRGARGWAGIATTLDAALGANKERSDALIEELEELFNVSP